MKQLIKVCTLLNVDQIKQLKVLASKAKTYEQDIEEVNREKLRSELRSSNDLKGTTKLF